MIKAALKLSLIVFCSMSFAQSEPDPDWPCIQVLIPKISAATIWDGPSVDKVSVNPEDSKLAKNLVANVIDKDQELTDAMLDDYLQQTQGTTVNESLTYLFKEFLNKLNDKRSTQIKTIKRYTRTQRGAAEKIEKILNQITELQDQQDQATQLEDLESELHWQKRMFKEREKSFQYLCELPQEIFQQSGEVARQISMRLEY